jgi:hypothetical protein
MENPQLRSRARQHFLTYTLVRLLWPNNADFSFVHLFAHIPSTRYFGRISHLLPHYAHSLPNHLRIKEQTSYCVIGRNVSTSYFPTLLLWRRKTFCSQLRRLEQRNKLPAAGACNWAQTPLNPADGRKERQDSKVSIPPRLCCYLTHGTECTATWRWCSFSHSPNEQEKTIEGETHRPDALLGNPRTEILKRDSFMSPCPQKRRTFLSLAFYL